MNRRHLLGVLFAGAALAAVPTAALAQLPPDPPATYYGTATGLATGADVVAMVGDGNSFVACGAGKVILDNNNPVYVVDVFSDSQRTGCGRSGRTIRFYIGPSGSTPGRLANETSSWAGPGPRQVNLTVGGALSTRSYAAAVTSEKR
ncbi:MAG: hypothetical protein ACKVVT_18960 [Dehalococcoidia bacterium]